MPEQTNESIERVFCEVLENLAFMFGECVSRDEIPAGVESCIEASVSYTGPTSGTLKLLAPESVAGELAANVLGLDGDDAEAGGFGFDAIGELMNVTVGQLLTELAGDEPVFDLTPPRVHSETADRWQQVLNESVTVSFLVDDNPILLQLQTCDAKCQNE